MTDGLTLPPTGGFLCVLYRVSLDDLWPTEAAA